MPDPSPATLASSALYLAQRDLSHYTSLGQPSAWTDSSLAGFRLAASAGDRGRYWKSVELGAAPKKGEEAGSGTSAVVQVGPAASGLSNAFDVRVKDDAGIAFSDVVASVDQPLATSPNATTINAHLAEHLARIDIVSPDASNLVSGALPAGETLHVFNTAEQYAGAVEVKVPSWMSKVGTAGKAAGAQAGAGGARAPMRAYRLFGASSLRSVTHARVRSMSTASKIVQVFVKEGQSVEAGAPLVAVEAMKTVSLGTALSEKLVPDTALARPQEHVLRAAKSGVVEKVSVKEGDLVPEGKILVAFVEEVETAAAPDA